LEYFPEPCRTGPEGAGATSPRITLEIRRPDRPAESRTLGPGRIIIGRESGDVVLDDPETSALHAELEFTQGRVIVRDLGSRNGTWRDGKRLPQFALFPGQRFICGTTQILLQSMEGTDDVPRPGGTAVGGKRPDAGPGQSSATLPAEAALAAEENKPSTVVSGGAPPPPGFAPVDLTAAARSAPPPASTTLVAPKESVDPFEPAAGVAPFAAPAAAAAPVLPMAHDGSAPVFLPHDGSQPVVLGGAAPGAPPRGPVANAVIKPGERLGRKRRSGAPGSGRRILKIVALSTLGAGAVAALVFGIWTLIAGRNVAFFKSLAAEMPQDAIGLVAVRSPEAVLDLFGDDLPPELVEQAKEELGFDPFDAAAYAELGIDMKAPMGITLLDREGVIAVSIGASDKDKLREAMKKKPAELAGLDEDLRWIERSFEDVPGMWLDEPIPAAALFSEERVIFVVGRDPDEVGRWAKSVAGAPKGDSLAERPGFEGLAHEKGKLLLAAYVDGGSGRAALPGKGVEAMALRAAFADVDGVALSLVEDGPRVHLAWQTVVREGSEMIETFKTKGRDPKALARLAAPVLASFDSKIDPAQVYRSISAIAMFGLGMEKAEREFRESTGLDLQTDIFDNLSGDVGQALLRLPTEEDDKDWAAVVWFGVKDADKAKKAAEQLYAKMGAELDIELEQAEGTTLYVSEGLFRIAYLVHEGHLWFLLGKADPAPIVKGPAKAFTAEARIPEIAKALEKGGLAAGFVDIKQLLAAMRPLMSESERERETELSAVLGPLEALTVRGRVEKRAVVMHATLHTSADEALPTLVRGLVDVAGAQFAKQIARKRRQEKCATLVEHIVGLMQKELGEGLLADKEPSIREDMHNECMSDDTTIAEIDCMIAAQSTEALTKCEGVGAGEGGGTPVDSVDPEPTPVPFVDDIWPNTQPVAGADGKPDPSVNYAVGIGEGAASRGPEDALVTIVVFGDFECPYTKRTLGTLDEVMAEHGTYTRIVFRHNPLSMHPNARTAARAALAAHRQDKFWQMHDKLFDNQRTITEDNIRVWAGDIGLDMSKFEIDFADHYNETIVDTDAADAKKFGAHGTPSFFVNGRFLGGTQPKHAFDRLIEEEKARAEKYVERRGNTKKRLYTDMLGHFAAEVGASKAVVTDLASEARYTIDTLDLPRKGASGYARVALVECGDFDCPFCSRARTTVDDVIAAYPTLTVYWLHNPLAHHAGAEPAARAAVAANNQGKFWEMHDKLFADTSKRTDADFSDMARELGLDITQFEADFASETTKELVEKQAKICRDNDATSTPSFFINGRLLTGARSKEEFAVTIDKELSGGI
jgi:protein-disulfide isomerase